MVFSSWEIYLCLCFLVLFTSASIYLTRSGKIPQQWIDHPLIYTLALGIYIDSWAYYGSSSLVYEFGYGFLAFYLGISGTFLLAPVLLQPISRLTRKHQLGSLADLLAFRYRSQGVGSLTTLISVVGILILAALQLQAVCESIKVIAPDSTPWINALLLTVITGLIAITLTPQTHDSHHQIKPSGLIVTLATASAFKLFSMLLIGLYALGYAFGGFEQVDQWIQEQGSRVSAFDRHIDAAPWQALLLMFFGAALVLPQMFHVIFNERRNTRSLLSSSWMFPAFLLLFSLPFPILFWAGISLSTPTAPEYYALGISQIMDKSWLTLLVFSGGSLAAISSLVVIAMAVSQMLLNHLAIPLIPPSPKHNIYQWLYRAKKRLIGLFFALSFCIYIVMEHQLTLTTLGILGISLLIQLLPAGLAVIYWPQANKAGVFCGLILGTGAWFLSLLLPMAFQLDATSTLLMQLSPEWTTLPWQDTPLHHISWHQGLFISLALNCIGFVVGSLVYSPGREELDASRLCSLEYLAAPDKSELAAGSSEEFISLLARPLGYKAARREVEKAMNELGLNNIEYRPYPLKLLRNQIESNLSGLMGPSVAKEIIQRHLSFKSAHIGANKQDLHLFERSLEDYHSRLTGLAAELDSLRRYHRKTVEELPSAACMIDPDKNIQMWNRAMASVTNISEDEAVDTNISNLPHPWVDLLQNFLNENRSHRYKKNINLKGESLWFNLHKSWVREKPEESASTIVLLEDQTELVRLESELTHSERLASVGRFAAGVAHEIGNPVTGIACLAQNMKLETRDEVVLQSADDIIQQTKRISTIVQSLTNFSRADQSKNHNKKQQINLYRCADEAIKLLSLNLSDKHLQFINQLEPELTIQANEQMLIQVFINLLTNASDASEEGERIIISGTKSGYSVTVSVADQGCGIQPEKLDQIFEPFYTTKAPNQGTGLGLSLVYSIIEEHNGHLKVTSPYLSENGESIQGTKISFSLPSQTLYNEEIS